MTLSLILVMTLIFLNQIPLIILIWEDIFFWGLHELRLFTSFTEPYSLLVNVDIEINAFFQLCDVISLSINLLRSII